MTQDDFLLRLDNLATAYPVAESMHVEAAYDIDLDDTLVCIEWDDRVPGLRITCPLPWPFEVPGNEGSNVPRHALWKAALQFNWENHDAEGGIAFGCLPGTDTLVAMWTLHADETTDHHRLIDALRLRVATVDEVWTALCADHLMLSAPGAPASVDDHAPSVALSVSAHLRP